MRRPTLALSTALAAIGLSAGIAPAQQSSPPTSPVASSPAEPADPMLASKATRYLLRNGMDYLAYREYARALSFFRAVEARQKELSPAEIASLKKGIARAQQGMREAVNTPRVVNQPSKGRPGVQPGAFALARPSTADPVQLASAELPAPPPITPTDPPAPSGVPRLPARLPAPAPEPVAVQASVAAPEPVAAPMPVPTPANAPSPTQDGPEVVPAGLPAPLPPPIGLEMPSGPEPSPSPSPAPVDLPPAAPVVAEPAPVDPPVSVAEALPSPPPVLATSGIELPPGAPIPSEPAPTAPATDPAPSVPGPLEPVPASDVPPRLALAPDRGDTSPPAPMAVESAPAPAASPEPPPAPEAAPLPPLPGGDAPTAAPASEMPESILPPRLRREVEMIAQTPAGSDRPGGAATSGAGGAGATLTDPTAGSTPSQGSTRLELQRAPSPTEARPIRRIPVPEEYVPLGARDWTPGRKYWAAAGTCHMTLYFQDPVLERYGQGVEQALGPRGRFFSYPLDDPRQSNQRNQILQPFYSIGKFCFQVGTLPYKFLVDPPWESEYDLGYYRPGDPIPPDTVYITPKGLGPPLKGRNY